jgi:hypothetical protein
VLFWEGGTVFLAGGGSEFRAVGGIELRADGTRLRRGGFECIELMLRT